MKSMTGYGRGQAAFSGQHITVEINSVNRKQLELAISLPRLLNELEPHLRDELNHRISRGRIAVTVALHGVPEGRVPGINVDAAKAYQQQLHQLAIALGMEPRIDLRDVLRGPGVVLEEEVAVDASIYWEPLKLALEAALEPFEVMRRREGGNLEKDLVERIRKIETELAAVKEIAPRVLERHRQNLLDRIAKAGLEIQPNDERLLKEIIFFSDKSDITEELTRLASHLDQFHETLKRDEPLGRTLDFLIQEMNREVNTIGSKGNDVAIAQSVVVLKTEMEKIREQVQNVE